MTKLSPKQTHILKFGIVFVLGFAWAFSLRFILVDRPEVHYHANFAIYVDGVRDKLDRFTFYEEVAACSPAYATAPESRVHLHDNIPTAIHVHDEAATWNHLMNNLGYSVSDDVLETDAGILIADDDKQLRFVLNGRFVTSVANERIDDEDVLLIDYSGDSDDTLLLRYAEIPTDADVYNVQSDPAACQGGSGESFTDRFKRTLGIE